MTLLNPQEDLRKNWKDFWFGDPFEGDADFADRMVAAGLIFVCRVDIGIKEDTNHYALTTKGEQIFGHGENKPSRPFTKEEADLADQIGMPEDDKR